MKKGSFWYAIFLIVFISVVIYLIYYASYKRNYEINITNFKECVSAGNFVMESYPRQCRANGVTFIEEIDDAWRIDDIVLMEHEEDGTLGCFGCSLGVEPKICIDPDSEMKQIEETSVRYCNKEFEVVENL